MIKAILEQSNGRRVLVFGVTREKAERFIAGRSVLLRDVDDALPGLSILLVGGEDDDDIERAVRAQFGDLTVEKPSQTIAHILDLRRRSRD